MAVTVLGNRPQPVFVYLNPGRPFAEQLTQTQNGVELDWPAGTSSTITFSDATGFNLTCAATVTANVLAYNMAADIQDTIPDGALVEIGLTIDPAVPEKLWLSGTAVYQA